MLLKVQKKIVFEMICGSGPEASTVSIAERVAFMQVCESMINAWGYIYLCTIFIVPIALNILNDNDKTL